MEGVVRKGSVRRIPASRGSNLKIGCFLTLVSLLQVYFVLTSRKIQGLHLCRAEFVQRLISNRLSSPLKYIFFLLTHSERLIELFREAGGKRSSQPGTIN